ncbi:hypothetical protein CB1_000327021 [Camelus ferus]|nr:hypothetical protein CB1_000327021 [Camelus ferus]
MPKLNNGSCPVPRLSVFPPVCCCAGRTLTLSGSPVRVDGGRRFRRIQRAQRNRRDTPTVGPSHHTWGKISSFTEKEKERNEEESHPKEKTVNADDPKTMMAVTFLSWVLLLDQDVAGMYNKMWHQTQEALTSLLDKESQKMMEPHQNQVFIFQMLATFYIKYVQIFRNLENVYDQIVHPQKRILIRKILDGVMGRILELKNEMVELELTEFHYFDDLLQDLKLAPKYPVRAIPLEEAIKVIQVAERARQGRLRAMFMKQIFLQEYRARQAKILGEKIADAGAAALRIQKVWRGFQQSKKAEREREEEMIFLGMNPPPLFNEVGATIIEAEKVTHMRDKVQMKHEEDYRGALVTIKDDLKLTEGPDIKENLQEQIRRWFIECSERLSNFKFAYIRRFGEGVLYERSAAEQTPVEHSTASRTASRTAQQTLCR